MPEAIKYERIVEICDEKRRAYDRACGTHDATLTRIKNEFKVDTIEEAKALLEKMQRITDKRKSTYSTQLEAFMAKHPDVS